MTRPGSTVKDAHASSQAYRKGRKGREVYCKNATNFKTMALKITDSNKHKM